MVTDFSSGALVLSGLCTKTPLYYVYIVLRLIYTCGEALDLDLIGIKKNLPCVEFGLKYMLLIHRIGILKE